MALNPFRVLKNTLGPRTCVTLMIGLMAACLVWHFTMRTSPSLSHRFVVGQRLTYRLEYLSASASDVAGLTQEPAEDGKDAQAIYTNVEADLHATVLEVTADGAWIAFTLRNPEVQVVVNGELAIQPAETIQADLSRTAVAFVERQGRIRAVHFHPRVTSLSHAFARALLATTQVVLPDDSAAVAWETREYDPNGEYGVQYKREADALFEPNVAVLSKERTHYLPAKRAHSIRFLEVDSVAQPGGHLTIRFDEVAGHVQSVEGREATTIQVNGKTVARAETTLKMNFLGAETLSLADLKRLRAEGGNLKDETAVALSTSAPSKAEEAALHRNELGDATLETVLAELARFDAHGDPDASDTRLYFKLKALIYLHPEACPHLAKMLNAARTQSPTMELLTDALSSVGHAAAQTALQSAIRARREDAQALAMLVPALAMVEAPSRAAEDTLRELAANSAHAQVRASAELGLGTMAHQLASAAPERSLRIALGIAEKLKTASSPEARRHLLFVLGNAGARETLDVIVPYLNDTSPEIRAAAAAALRWINAPTVDELLCAALATDADPAVRVEAVTSLGFRTMTPTTFETHKTAFLKDASTNVRVAVLQNLARAQGAFPEGRTLLAQAVNDPSQDVREEAANLLAIE